MWNKRVVNYAQRCSFLLAHPVYYLQMVTKYRF